MSKGYSISLATVVLLVLLRVNIGWHFFSEGMKHYADPHWTSEPVLRNAKGPLAPMYQSYLPDFHGFEEALHGDRPETNEHAVQAWLDAIGNDWDARRAQFAEHYGLDEQQIRRAKAIAADYQNDLRNWSVENKDALITHVHEWHRKETTKAAQAADVPFQQQRVTAKQAELAGEANGWQAQLKKMEADYDQALAKVLNDDQRGRAPLPHPRTSIDAVDRVMTYGILAIDVLLLLGLFTRTACVAGAAFLLSVVMMQPFWVSETAPTFNQYVEMFALLTLATTAVGRWAGLDFFVHNLIAGSTPETNRDER